MWLALTFKIEPSFVEPLSDALLALGAVSVDVADAHAGGPQEVLVFAEPNWNSGSHWTLAQFRVLVTENCVVEQILSEACEAAGQDRETHRHPTLCTGDRTNNQQS